MSENIPYIIAEDGYYYVAYKEKVKVPEIVVSAKGVANGLSEEYNDGWDFGPDSYSPTSTSAIPYTQTVGWQEAGNYAATDNIQKVKIKAGIYTIDTPIIASPSSSIDWYLITFEGESSIINVLSGNNPTIDNMTVLMPSSSFTGTSLITNNYISASNTFRDIAFNLNGLAINGFKFETGSGVLNSELQATQNFFNLSFWNGSGGSSYAYIYQADGSTWNYVIQNCTFSDSEYAVYFNNTGSVNWLMNCQDFTTYGLYDNATQLLIIGGIYQGIGTGDNTLIWIWGASFSNAYVNPVFNIDSNNTSIKIYSSFIAIPSSGSVFKLYTSNTGISVHDTAFGYYTTPVGSLFSGGYTLGSLDWKNNTYGGASGVFPATSDLDGYTINYVSLPTTVNALSLVVIEPTAPTLSANPPVSGTVYQNTNPYAIEIDLPAYASTSGTAGYVTIAKGSTDTPTAIANQYVSGDTSSTSTDIIRLRVPAGWYYEFTGSGVTFGTATPFAE